MEIVIQGRVISKKNNVRYNRGFATHSKSWFRFEREALHELGKLKLKYIKPPYKINYTFYMKGRGATDVDNMIAGINDILQKAGVIEDDKHVHSGGFDKVLNSDSYYTVVNVESLKIK